MLAVVAAPESANAAVSFESEKRDHRDAVVVVVVVAVVGALASLASEVAPFTAPLAVLLASALVLA